MTDDANIENTTDGDEAVPSVLESIPEEQRNSWEGPARTSDLPPADQYAAILYRGGREGSAREIQEEFDLWVFTTSTEVILKAKDDRIIMADTLDDLQRRLDARYPAPPACSLLKHDVHTIRLNWVKQEDRWGHSSRSEYKRKQIRITSTWTRCGSCRSITEPFFSTKTTSITRSSWRPGFPRSAAATT